MADPWIPAQWLRTAIPWGRGLELISGAYVSKELRLVRPAADAGMRDTWVADHFGRQTQVAVTFASGHIDAQGRGLSVPADTRAAHAERFARRALLGTTLADPHLVQIFETGEVKGVPFIVTELLEGKSLRHRLVHDGALSLAETRAVLAQVATVLAKCHAHGVPHGDIRSDHLFSIGGASAKLTAEPFVKVSNVAAGPRHAPGSEEATSLLDNAYMSPERLLRSSGDDVASDLWALAVTLYELLTTTLPFEASTPAGVAVAICNAQFSPPSHYRADLPSSVDAWFSRALSRDPLERFKSVLELSQTFNQALEAGSPAAQTSDDAGAWSEAAPDDDDDEEEEKTVKWDLPADWSLPGSSPRAADPLAALPPRLPSVRPPLPASAALPSAALPSLALASGSSRVTLPPVTRPGAFFTGDLARVARLPPAPHTFTLPALRAAAAPFVDGIPSPRRLGMLGQGLLFGAALGAVSALSLWIVQSLSAPSQDSTATAELALEPTYDGEGNVIAQKPSARRIVDPKELPRIIQTDDLPTLPEASDDELDEASETITVSSVKSEPPASASSRGAALPAPPVQKASLALANSRPAASASAAATPRSAASRSSAASQSSAPAPRRQARPAPPKRTKAASSCNPPYYFDSNNIRRLKLECL